MAQYKFHTNKMPQYMKHPLYQINQTKKAFRDAYQIDKMIQAGKSGHLLLQNGMSYLITQNRSNTIEVQLVLSAV